jgi:hypothetical protein
MQTESFAPFGRVLAARRPIDLYGGSIDVYSGGPIDADVPVEFLLSRSSVREPSSSRRAAGSPSTVARGTSRRIRSATT